MESINRSPYEIGNVEKGFIYIVLFFTGYEFLVPVDVSELADEAISLPFWASRMELIHGLFIKDALFIIYFLSFVVIPLRRIPLDKQTIFIASLILSLSVVGIVSAVLSVTWIQDIFEALRLLFFSIYFVCLVFWSKSLGAVKLLAIFFVGVFTATIVNLYFTFTASWMTMGILPRLLGQNGPGGAMGFLMNILTWFFLLNKNKRLSLYAIIFCFVGVFTLIISFSKLGMIMGALGLIGMLTLVLKNSSPRQLLIRISLFTAIVFGVAGWFLNSSLGKDVIDSAKLFYEFKFARGSESIIDAQDSGDQERIYYFRATSEVFIKYPLFGVSYMGFADAVSKTNAYKYGSYKVIETDAAGANPHNAFLYYISANGILGWLITIGLYLTFLWVSARFLWPFGLLGLVIFGCLFGATIIHVNTLPSFFNTPIMYLPCAIVLSVIQKDPQEESEKNNIIRPA